MFWRDVAANGDWAHSETNQLYRQDDGWNARRVDLAKGQWNYTGTKQYAIAHIGNAVYPTMTVNGDLGGKKYHIHQILFENSTDRTINNSSEGYLSLGGGTGNAKIEAVTGKGTGTYTFNVPITYEKSVELNPVGGNLIFNFPIDNGGFNTDVSGSAGKSLSIASMSGAGGLTIKSNPTTVKITGTSTYTGNTNVDYGTLELQADLSSEEIIVANGAILVINGNDVDVEKLTINSGGTVEVLPGKSLTVNGELTNNGILTLKSDANGTATIKTLGTVTNGGTTNYKVEQYLASGRNWWYLASPTSSATSYVIAPTGSTNKIGDYNEATTSYSAPFTAGSATALTVGKGNVIKFSDTNAKTVTFTGGSLNTGDVSPSVTRTGTTAAKRGFNLVGNPYPSYLDWKEVYDATTTQNMRPTIWYRTFDAITTENPTGMVFKTYNASLNVGVPSGTNQYVAPMQAFWVKVNLDGTTGTPVSSTGTLKFTNDNRDHAIEGTTTLLKAPALNDKQIIRLQLVNGTINDETVIVGVPEANDNYDLYDSEKMSISDTSMEIYTLAGTEKLIINGMNSLTEGKTVTLGFRPGQAGTFTIEATQLDNIDAKIILVDKVAVKEQELTAETPYTFVSDETPTNDRFLIKLVSKVPTGVDNTAATGDLTVYVNRNNRIQLICGIELNDQATVTVYNVAGQKLSTQKLSKATAELNGTYNPGVYMIQLTNGSQATTKKLIIR